MLCTKGPLARDATVADLLSHLAKSKDEHVEVIEENDDTVVVRGFLSDYDAYRTHRLPMAYAVAAAHEEGDMARVTFLGESDGEFVATFVDGKGELSVSQPDPQNLTEDDWHERIPDMAEIDAGFAAK